MEIFLIGLAVLTAPIWIILACLLMYILTIFTETVFTLLMGFVVALWCIAIAIIAAPFYYIVRLINRMKS